MQIEHVQCLLALLPCATLVLGLPPLSQLAAVPLAKAGKNESSVAMNNFSAKAL